MDPAVSAIQPSTDFFIPDGRPWAVDVLLDWTAIQGLQDWLKDHDDSDFAEGGYWDHPRLGEYLASRGRDLDSVVRDRLLAGFGMEYRLDSGMKVLSSGELAKSMVILVLSCPGARLHLGSIEDPLDHDARIFLRQALADSALHCCTLIQDGCYQDPQPGSLPDLVGSPSPDIDPASTAEEGGGVDSTKPVVLMRRVRIAWTDRVLLEDFDLEIKAGEHVFVQGPNGCGKTSLLGLINGENPQVWSNHVEICGIRRGSGESIWDIRRLVGTVSQKFHSEYLYHGRYSIQEVLLSGFDSGIGFYRQPRAKELNQVATWLGALNLREQAAADFSTLPWGLQRILLVCRALICTHPILILDEPCQGLEPGWRGQLLDFLHREACRARSTIFHVSHDPSENSGFYTWLLAWDAVSARFVLEPNPLQKP